MPPDKPQFLTLHGTCSSFVLACNHSDVWVVYWGKRLSKGTTGEMLQTLRIRQEVPASPASEARLSLMPTIGAGFTGPAGLEVSANGNQWACKPEPISWQQESPNQITIICQDATRNIELTHEILLDPISDVLRFSTSLTNLSKAPLHVHWMAVATLPIEHRCTHILDFEGHWAKEFHTRQSIRTIGGYLRENRRGRTSHDAFPGIILHTNACNQQSGETYGFHLGWSGNHRTLCETMADGRSLLQMGELLLPGEVQLAENNCYQSPYLYASYSDQGLSQLSRQFHQFVRQHLIQFDVKNKPRPVHYNTWEGIYFDHDVATLLSLADKAAQLGVERFVLDDGWFVGRHNDQAGLGDWFVDETLYPDGLTPLIKHVNSLDMEFGLWVEPEMVNPDSNLFRQHPDWILTTQPNPDVGFRHQLVLDLSREEVFAYLFARIDTLLTEHNIAYLKWDMNRDLNQPGNHNGNPSVHLQTKALYRLLKKLRKAHPNVEIESCSSGGGRADYGVLQHTDRVWTSDSNDALDRLRIQQGFSYFFPSELMGSHIGPRDCHITHRNLGIQLRAATAVFGHMGMEMDLRELTDAESNQIKSAVKLYKKHRELIHTGKLYRLDLPAYAIGFGIVNEHQSEALFSYNIVQGHTTSHPERFHFAGIDPKAHYCLKVIWPEKSNEIWPQSTIFKMETNLNALDNRVFTGEALIHSGMQLPRLTPESNLIFYLQQVASS